MFDMMKMMGKVKEMQGKMKEAREQLKDLRAEGESGGGMVKAITNGNKELISLQIDESLVNKKDKEMMKDLIIAAVNKAVDEAGIKAREHIRKSTDGMLPNLPGMDLSGLV
ncbi:MAG: YbaB/EbfC family nucleoid-associated protein [Ekhidna sp.]|nr:YbaB/EbfC family nucleoid-associated protein [Ekhidna sp.]MBC6409180.1 YbaB/EbfC family nucleoid-associated protein [Ekhidna sp.]MBC6426328.1 YbaB/EbfC family nucleoid-associated protein [Ekhidna sp.]